MFDLTGKVALVTGAAHGLGKGIAICLAKAGAHVVINDICEPKEAEDALSQVETAEKPAVFMQADVSEEAEVTRLFQHIKERFGKLDILINNAGTSQDRDIYSITTDDWSRILKTNLTSGFLCSRAAFPLMRERQYGRIIFVSSVVGERGALFGHAIMRQQKRTNRLGQNPGAHRSTGSHHCQRHCSGHDENRAAL